MRSACESALAEAYLRVLGHVEAEAHWLGTYVYNFGLNHDILCSTALYR